MGLRNYGLRHILGCVLADTVRGQGRLYQAIDAAGFSVEGFARRMGVHRTTLWRFDRGVIEPAEADWYDRASLILGVPADELRPKEEAAA